MGKQNEILPTFLISILAGMEIAKALSGQLYKIHQYLIIITLFIKLHLTLKIINHPFRGSNLAFVFRAPSQKISKSVTL